MGIGNIKVVFQTGIAVIFLIKDRNSFCAFVDPSAKLPIPLLNLQDRRRVGALGVNKDLVVKGQLIIPAGGAYESRPFGRAVRNPLQDGFVHLHDKLVFGRHVETSFPFFLSFISAGIFRIQNPQKPVSRLRYGQSAQ
ncbi:MAG: hypothetical protein LBQ15_02935 [Clostridium sp.]|nr:hypothetical protein [Clostridium sp.]